LGVNTTSPAYKLEVNGPAAFGATTLTEIGDAGATPTIGYGMFHNSGVGLGIASIAGGSTQGIQFWSHNGTSFFESMRIAGSTGNVGIGITLPGSRLVVQGSGTTSATSALNVTNSTPTSLLFVRDDGNVGIGTTSPDSGSRVTISSTNQFGLNLENTGTGGVSWQLGATNNSYTSGGGKFVLTYGSLSSQSVFTAVQSTGNVGIGTTSPSAKLNVIADTTAQDQVVIFEGTGGLGSGLHLKASGIGGNTWRLLSTGNSSTPGANHFGIYSDSSGLYRMVVNPSGNVGISTTSPGSRLVVQGSGTTSATSALNVTNSTPTSLLFVRDDGNVGIGTSSPLYPVVIANRGPSGTPQRSLAIGNTATNGTFMYLGSSASTSGYNLIQSITTEGTDFGNLVLQPEAGNVGVATTSPQAKLHVAGTVRIDSTSSQPNTVGHNVELLYTNTAIDNVAMGEPDVWLQININGTVYAIPAYAPA
jgi:hypothetical protein